MKDSTKDVLIRALKTFWQAALASVMVSLPQIINLIPDGWDALKPVIMSAGVGAIAAGLSAVYNGLIKPRLEVSKDE